MDEGAPFRRGGDASSSADARGQAIVVAATNWCRVCEEALSCDALWRLLDVCHNLAGLLCGAEADAAARGGLLASAQALHAHRELMAVLASTLRADGAGSDGTLLTGVLAQLPRLAACVRAGADGSTLEVGLQRLHAACAGMPQQPPSLARAASKVQEARELSSHLLQCLGPEGGTAEPLPLSRAGDAMRSLHGFTAALATS